MPIRRTPFSYRSDPNVPDWDDARGLIVFDGECVLCSRFVQWVLAHDRGAHFRFAAAQGRLGQALYRHYGLDPSDYETSIVIDGGRVFEKLQTLVVAQRFAWPRRALALLAGVPRLLGDPVYNLVARNRYRWFGKRDACLVPDGILKARFLD